MKEELFDRVTPEMKDAAEKQIAEHHKIIDYDTREYPVEVIVDKYLTGLDEDENDFYVPDYQRDLTWPDKHQSRFIESVLMGLPIPLLFFADVVGKEGRAEIVDGSQRVRTLARHAERATARRSHPAHSAEWIHIRRSASRAQTAVRTAHC